MRVALGTYELDDEARKAIRKVLGGKGHATRGEAKDFLLAALNDDVVPNIGVEPAPPAATGGPAEAGTLPEPGSSPSSVNTVPAAGSAGLVGLG